MKIVRVCVCLQVFVCIHPTSAMMGTGGPSCLLLHPELSQEGLGRLKRDPSRARAVGSPFLPCSTAVLAHTDLLWCLLTWQHILTSDCNSSAHLRHPQRGHPLLPVGPQRDARVSAGGHLAPFSIWVSWLCPHRATPPWGC